ncbi:CobB/CobQ-like protein [Gleimia coleocanis DSM 15436]|uniref:Lipid II isoglutaminyl synthase (glutamine-hydrolyzing) subunit GatD n=1 Tax=Gleimia coleocanis DSM 15436 TaxID=525245 RepID=C0VYU1_9ACTO|nr:glutamine amidotransferase [Gleimia coleocanis]EEH64594.1 CobB/CobQ-like protein [Gleimia coleocanis DSM 15436]
MKPIQILQLYPKDMNLYGDWGNTLTLQKRLEWRGIPVEVVDHNPGDSTDFRAADIILGGGGQDAGQAAIQADLLAHSEILRELVADGMPMLMICGLYQMFGRRFLTGEGTEIRGIGVIPAETRAMEARLIGNITLENAEFGTIVGYENHSGQTFLDAGVKPFGTVKLGAGNNDADGVEGAWVKNLIGTYLHGALLPRNPQVADYLLSKALERRAVTGDLDELEGYSAETGLLPLTEVDQIARSAHEDALKRSR